MFNKIKNFFIQNLLSLGIFIFSTVLVFINFIQLNDQNDSFAIFSLIVSFMIVILSLRQTIKNTQQTQNIESKIVESYNRQKEKDRPILNIINRPIFNNNAVTIKIFNSGDRPAENVTFHFSSHPNPFFLATNNGVILSKIPNGLEHTFSFNMFGSPLTKLVYSHSKDENKQQWDKFLKDFNSNTKVLLIKFMLKYEYRNQKYQTEERLLTFDKTGHFSGIF